MICKELERCYDSIIDNKGIPDCPNDITQCIKSHDARSEVKCKQKGKSYILKNDKHLHIVSYKIDGGAILQDKKVPEETRACDNLYCINDKINPTAILIELKGKHIRHAIKQILNTYEIYKTFLTRFCRLYIRIVVTSSTPKLFADPLYVKLSTIVKQQNGNIKIKEITFIENYSLL